MKDEITKILVDGSSQKDEIMQGQLIVIPRRIQPRRVKIIKKTLRWTGSSKANKWAQKWMDLNYEIH